MCTMFTSECLCWDVLSCQSWANIQGKYVENMLLTMYNENSKLIVNILSYIFVYVPLFFYSLSFQIVFRKWDSWAAV